MLPYDIVFCTIFFTRSSARSLDLLIMQTILASLDDGIDFIVVFFYNVAISGFNASSDARFVLGGIFY
jgi:hypothetical protein